MIFFTSIAGSIIQLLFFIGFSLTILTVKILLILVFNLMLKLIRSMSIKILLIIFLMFLACFFVLFLKLFLNFLFNFLALCILHSLGLEQLVDNDVVPKFILNKLYDN